MVDWPAYRSDFPLLNRSVYLDTASVSPSPAFLSDAVEPFFEEKEQGFLSAGWREQKRRCQEQLADHLDVLPEEIVFLSNTTEAINMIANALDWNQGDEVVISNLNFASNVIPWLRLRDSGVRVKVVESSAGTLSVDELKTSISDQTRLVSLPHVSSSSGYRFDLDELGDAVSSQDALLSIDGVQAVGTRQPALENVDVYAFSIFKWLLGPFGMGMMYVNRDVADDLTPSTVGYGSVVDGPVPRFEDFDLKTGPQKFQYAHANYPAIYCLSELLEYISTIGIDAIEERIRELTGYLIEALSDLPPIRLITPSTARAGIVSFDHDAFESSAVVEQLANEDIHVADRAGHVRVSCHFYNNRDDIDALVNALADLG